MEEDRERPEALVKVAESRARLTSGEVEFSWEHSAQPGWTVYYTARFAGPDNISINRGDARGLVGVRPGDKPSGALQARGVRQTLMARGEFWVQHQEQVLSADLLEGDARIGNIWKLRTLGVSYRNSFDDLHDTLWRDGVKQPAARK